MRPELGVPGIGAPLDCCFDNMALSPSCTRSRRNLHCFVQHDARAFLAPQARSSALPPGSCEVALDVEEKGAFAWTLLERARRDTAELGQNVDRSLIAWEDALERLPFAAS